MEAIAGSVISGVIGNMINGGSGGADQGYGQQAQALRQALQQAQTNAQPYLDFGQQGMAPYSQVTQQMTPYANGDWMKSYQMSPAAQYLSKYAQQGMNNSAAAGGILGSGQNIRGIGDLSEQIASQDMQNFYNNGMGALTQQQQGYGNQINTGANAMQGYNQLASQLQSGIGTAEGNQSVAHAQGINSLLGLLGNGVQGGYQAYQNYNQNQGQTQPWQNPDNAFSGSQALANWYI